MKPSSKIVLSETKPYTFINSSSLTFARLIFGYGVNQIKQVFIVVLAPFFEQCPGSHVCFVFRIR